MDDLQKLYGIPQYRLIPNEYCLKLAIFLANGLNTAYANTRLTNTDLPEALVVRSIRNYDAINVPLSEFPLLKVYRLRDQYQKRTTHKEVSAAITYSLTYPELDLLPDLLVWISENLNLLFLEYQRDEKSELYLQNPQPLIAEHLLTINEQQQAVYPFLRFQFSFKENSFCC